MPYNMERDAKYWIDKLQLSKHPEGGFYKETFRADTTICLDSSKRRQDDLTQPKARSISSTIYYLLEGTQVSLFHRMNNADEIWHFYSGSSLTIYLLEERTRKIIQTKLGNKLENGEMFQIRIRKGLWFGARVNDESSYTLAGCTVYPAFMFEDFQLADRKTLTGMYPEHRGIIETLTTT